MQSHDERDMEGLAARRDREAVVKEFSAEEITGRYEGEELDAVRVGRLPEERFSRRKKKHDELRQGVEKKHDELKQGVEKKHDELKQGVEKKHDELKQDVEKKHDELKQDVKEVRLDVKGLSGRAADVRADGYALGGGGLVEPLHKLGVL